MEKQKAIYTYVIIWKEVEACFSLIFIYTFSPSLFFFAPVLALAPALFS